MQDGKIGRKVCGTKRKKTKRKRIPYSVRREQSKYRTTNFEEGARLSSTHGEV